MQSEIGQKLPELPSTAHEWAALISTTFCDTVLKWIIQNDKTEEDHIDLPDSVGAPLVHLIQQIQGQARSIPIPLLKPNPTLHHIVALNMQSAEYHRAAAARARKLRADATTRWLKEHLEDEIVRHEQIAEEIERVSDPNAEEGETPALASETSRR